ncbi:auxin efflux carrier [Lasiosphaeria miniovina]|uniref:Auxin efflux carrier n=1 Tax=Lasiosphaeria miniovina TaxID=1954250 RepID=A0AA40DZE4_9PEZI|nr:auxin efflux carrier [Lasiosphaeria miniovina]KAK0718551.1 auxin efflux carrier [Lasiosphaeria miniovina]
MSGLFESFLAAIQASLSVLFVIFYGGIAAWLGLLDHSSTKAISKICVRMFLPALLITKIGSELHAGSATRYLIIFAWAIVCHLISFLLGIFAHFGLGMPDWVTVALMFNNTTSYPLLLITALDDTGILKSLIVTDETSREAIERAKSYFLVFATVSSCLTFAVGPRLIDSEHAPEPEADKEDDPVDNGRDQTEAGEETGLLNPRSSAVQFLDPFGSTSFFPSNRRPSVAPRSKPPADRRASIVPRSRWSRLSPRTKWWLLFISDFFNAPLLGAVIGAVIGLVPPLHHAFFSASEDGGIFTAWLTASLKNIGGLFVPLPVVVAGVSLYTSMKSLEQDGGSSAAKLPWLTVTFILVVRFVLWPIASIGFIYLIASRTELLSTDPMLWFTMMLMPTGPPAMKLITLIQVSDGEPDDEVNISKLLTISYIMSPILSFTVVGSLLASEAGIR